MLFQLAHPHVIKRHRLFLLLIQQNDDRFPHRDRFPRAFFNDGVRERKTLRPDALDRSPNRQHLIKIRLVQEIAMKRNDRDVPLFLRSIRQQRFDKIDARLFQINEIADIVDMTDGVRFTKTNPDLRNRSQPSPTPFLFPSCSVPLSNRMIRVNLYYGPIINNLFHLYYNILVRNVRYEDRARQRS